jgi:hypothetical protein
MPASMRGLRQLVHKSVDEKRDRIEAMFDMMMRGRQREHTWGARSHLLLTPMVDQVC